MPGGRPTQKGGYRQPANPAAVSGPGAMSARTDGGAGAKQPIRPIPSTGEGKTIGDRAASVAQQQGAPLAATQPVGGVSSAQPASPAAFAEMDPFGPTNRPSEPVTAGAALGAGAGPQSGDRTLAFLQAAFQQDPYDDNIRDLIEILQERQR